MSRFLATASSLLRHATNGAVDLPYDQRQTWDIELAGNKAAFDMVEAALNRKITDLGLNCPVKRIEKGYLNEIVLEAGNLNKSGMKWDGDAQIVLQSLAGRAGYLESSLEKLYKPDEVRPDIAHFTVRCPTNSWYRNPSRKFMEFFEALGFGQLREFFDMKTVDLAIKSGDAKWVGHTMGGFFDAAVSGAINGVTYGNMFCPTVGFLQALDINPADFAKAVTTARVEKAKQFGPVRETRTKTLAYDIGFG